MIGNKGNISLPHISGTSDSERITQIISYLRQLVEHINWTDSTDGTSQMSFGISNENGTEKLQVKMQAGMETHMLTITPTNFTYSKNGTIMWEK